MKRIIALICMITIAVTGCGADAGDDSEPTAAPTTGKTYKEESFAALPNEHALYDEDTLQVTDLQTNMQGEPALYQLIMDTDENDEDYAAICEYTLNAEGNWQVKECFRKAMTKLVKKILQEKSVDELDIPYVIRGDDGNLYALLKIVEAGSEPTPMGRDEKLPTRYSVLAMDESKNTIQEVGLQTKAEADGTEIDYATEYDVSEFHVMEDGTYFLVYSGASAMWFDSVSGVQTNICASISDSAFGKQVGYGETDLVYFSMSKKKFGILDGQALTLTAEFGEEIPEKNRNFEWYFDTDTTNWQMYVFNQSGLYRLGDLGKKTSATQLSATGNFDRLADANIYDIKVGTNEELYLLVRQASEDTSNHETSWDFGVIKYEAA